MRSPPVVQIRPLTRQPIDLRATGLVLMLCLIWGVQQVAMKVVAGDVAPIMQLAIRFAGASIFFGFWVVWREGRGAFRDGTLPSGLLLGLMFSLEFLFVGEALLFTTAAHTIVFLYSAPIFTALGLQFLPEERLERLQWVGIAAAFLGIVVAFLGPGGRPVANLIIGDVLALLGGIFWGLSNIVLRRSRMGGAAIPKTVLYQVGVASLVLFAFAALTRQTRLIPSAPAIAGLIFQTLVISILGYLVWFWLLRRYLTSRLMLMSLMTPLFGVLFGAVVLGDAIDLRFALGSLLVLSGILFVNSRAARRP
jgi:drug/metabolite transporter (DMT)-like permease